MVSHLSLRLVIDAVYQVFPVLCLLGECRIPSKVRHDCGLALANDAGTEVKVVIFRWKL